MIPILKDIILKPGSLSLQFRAATLSRNFSSTMIRVLKTWSSSLLMRSTSTKVAADVKESLTNANDSRIIDDKRSVEKSNVIQPAAGSSSSHSQQCGMSVMTSSFLSTAATTANVVTAASVQLLTLSSDSEEVNSFNMADTSLKGEKACPDPVDDRVDDRAVRDDIDDSARKSYKFHSSRKAGVPLSMLSTTPTNELIMHFTVPKPIGVTAEYESLFDYLRRQGYIRDDFLEQYGNLVATVFLTSFFYLVGYYSCKSYSYFHCSHCLLCFSIPFMPFMPFIAMFMICILSFVNPNIMICCI